MRSDQFTNIAQYLCSEMGLGLIRTRISHDNLVPFRSNLKILYFFQKPKTNLGNYPPPLLYHSAGVVGVPEICWDLEY